MIKAFNEKDIFFKGRGGYIRMILKQIISGGQTGVGQAALDIAIELNEHQAAAQIIKALWRKLRKTHALRVVQ